MHKVYSVGDFSPPGKCNRMNDMQNFHPSETQNGRQNCQCENQALCKKMSKNLQLIKISRTSLEAAVAL
jgi:hypothetical protein